ncbi:hypothetical protein CHS0354_037567, partial [Potamilus streckersoni]
NHMVQCSTCQRDGESTVSLNLDDQRFINQFESKERERFSHSCCEFGEEHKRYA